MGLMGFSAGVMVAVMLQVVVSGALLLGGSVCRQSALLAQLTRQSWFQVDGPRIPASINRAFSADRLK